jgi:hypothetical protein
MRQASKLRTIVAILHRPHFRRLPVYIAVHSQLPSFRPRFHLATIRIAHARSTDVLIGHELTLPGGSGHGSEHGADACLSPEHLFSISNLPYLPSGSASGRSTDVLNSVGAAGCLYGANYLDTSERTSGGKPSGTPPVSDRFHEDHLDRLLSAQVMKRDRRILTPRSPLTRTSDEKMGQVVTHPSIWAFG